jgi:prepilin-type N-terminal cleavage/methylation domain-containing protein
MQLSQRSLTRSQRGFSLIEVLVAMAILSFSLLAVAGMQLTAINANVAAQRLDQATTLVQDKIEELMARPFTHATLVDTTPVNAETSYDENLPNGWRLEWHVDTSADGSSKAVRVKIWWTPGRGPYVLAFTKNVFNEP